MTDPKPTRDAQLPIQLGLGELLCVRYDELQETRHAG
jgi:hypothetical protein